MRVEQGCIMYGVRGCLLLSRTVLFGAVLFCLAPLISRAEPAATNSVVVLEELTLDAVNGWDMDRCRVEMSRFRRSLRDIPLRIEEARKAAEAARAQAALADDLKPVVDEIARLKAETARLEKDLAVRVEASPLVTNALAAERRVMKELEGIHKSIAVLKSKYRDNLVEKDAPLPGAEGQGQP